MKRFLVNLYVMIDWRLAVRLSLSPTTLAYSYHIVKLLAYGLILIVIKGILFAIL
jgi:hypothetical protein